MSAQIYKENLEKLSDFSGTLGHYNIVKTETDVTIHSQYFNENCHSLAGAFEETEHNYIKTCLIEEKLKLCSLQSKSLRIFDVGFGVGIGLISLIQHFKDSPIYYFSVEIDREFLFKILKDVFLLNNLETKKFNDSDLTFVEFEIEKIKACIFIGDARKTIPLAFKENLIYSIDAIFQDPFSPKKNPTLWTVEWFTLLKTISKEEVRLSTYSSSISIRKSLMKAGFLVYSQKGYKNKRTMTYATLTGKKDELLEAEINKSPILELIDF